MEDQNKQRSEMDTNTDTESGIGGSSDTGSGMGTTPTPQENPSTQTETTPAADAEKQNGANLTPFIIGLVVLIVAAGLAYYFFYASGDGTAMSPNEGGETAQNVQIEPDQVVARVNGEELHGAELAYQMVQVAQSAGLPSIEAADQQTLDVIRSQSLDAIVNTELLLQEAETEGLTVENAEVESQFATIIESIGGQEVANERLQALGITEAEFKENLADDILIQKYLEENQGESVLEVSEEEIQNFYDQVSEGQEDVPPLEDVRSQIVEQLKFQKEQEALSSLVEELRANANVELLI